jgi:hypothetical protein
LKVNNGSSFVFAIGFIFILLAASTLLGPEVLFAQTIHYSSYTPLLSATGVTDVAFGIHPNKGNTHSDPPSASTLAASSTSSASTSSANASLIQITGGKVQDLSFTINNNNIPGTAVLPTSLTDLVVSLASQNNSVRILGPSTWNLPTITPKSVQKLTTQVYASASLIGSPVFFSVDIQYIQNSHQVKTASFNLGAIVIGNIQLSVNNVGIRYIGNTPNLVGSILNEGNTPAQFASIEMLIQGQGQSQNRVLSSLTSTSNKNSGTILLPTSSQYLGNIAANSPVPFNIPLQIVSPGKQRQDSSSSNNNSTGNIPPLTTNTSNQSTNNNIIGINNNLPAGLYPVSIKITYIDDLKNTRQLIVNNTVNVIDAQSSSITHEARGAGGIASTDQLQGSNSILGKQENSQITSSNGFVDVYWASNTARVASSNGTIASSSLQATPVPVQQEASPGDGQSILAVVLSNTEFSTINGITGYLTLPAGFSSATGGAGIVNNNIITTSGNSLQNPNQQAQRQISVAAYNNLVQQGQTYTLYFKVNVDKTATLGNHLASLKVYYFNVPNLEPGQYRSQTFAVPFVLPGKVILDTIPTTTTLNPGASNTAKIEIKNEGTAAAHGVVVSVTSVSGNSISGSNVGGSTVGSNNINSTTGPGSQITTITPPSSIPTVNLGARTFDIGTIPANGRSEIDPIIYPSYSAGGTLQNLNLQISYTNAIGGAITSSSSVGFLVLPTPPQAGISVAPFHSSNTSSTNMNANPVNSTSTSNSNNNTATAAGKTASLFNSQSSSSHSNKTNPSPSLSTTPTHSNTTNQSTVSGNNNRSNNGNPSGGITVSPSSYPSSNLLLKAIIDNNTNNTPIVPVVYKVAKGNNNSSATIANTAHTSGRPLSHSSANITKSAIVSNNNNNQLNSSSLILVAGNTEDMKFSVANNNDVPITNAVISIASQANGLKIVGDTLWSLASLDPHSTHQFSTKIFASTSLIAQPVSFLVTMQYISRGQSQVGSFVLGGTVIGSIHITASGIGINYIAGVPNLVGNLLNQGNTIGLYTTVQLINQPFSTANQSSITDHQQQHHQHQSGQLSAPTGASTTAAQSSAPAILPPSQYLGDLQPDSPLPFSIPITTNINNTAPGIYPVKLEVTYSDDLKNSHTTVLNNTVQLMAQQQKTRNGQGGGIFGFLTGGGSHGRGGGAGGGNGFLGIPFLFWIVIIAVIAIAVIMIRRRRKSRAALSTAANGREEGGDIGDGDEDIESLIDGSDTKKDRGSTKPPI